MSTSTIKFDELTVNLANGAVMTVVVAGEIDFSFNRFGDVEDTYFTLQNDDGGQMTLSDMKTNAEKQFFLLMQEAAEKQFEGWNGDQGFRSDYAEHNTYGAQL
jgi:hypothetical protein